LNAVFLRSLRRALDEIRPDILWLRSDKLAAHFAKLGGQRLIYEAHMIGTLYRQDRGANARQVERFRQMEQAIYSAAAGVAVINGLMLDEVRAMFGYGGPGAIIQGAVEPSLFQPLWKGGDGRTVVYAGTMQFWKGLELLLEALALAPGLRLKLIGGSKPEEIAQVERAAANLKIADRVDFCGRVPQRELPAMLAACACAVHPLPAGLNISERLTSPLKVFEYMSVGVPVVASDVPSLREFLQDGVNARLYAPGDARALADALVQVCADSAPAARLSKQARLDSGKYTFDARAENLVGLFGEAGASR
jgi:glycosyltransferase involved in cell wall biosynthesis